MTNLALVAEQPPTPGLPQWIAPTLWISNGRDPLGLQTITIDRIMPRLMPGILGLTRRARYLSYNLFILDEYRKLKLRPTNDALSAFLKAREYEYALAVQLCPHGCGSTAAAVQGRQRAGPAARPAAEALAAGDPSFPLARGESVKTFLGGYALAYRSPLIDLGLVAPAGTAHGDGVTPIDLLTDARADALADAFRLAVHETEYYQHHMRGVDPIPGGVLRDFAARACLCRLIDFPSEQKLLVDAFFRAPTPDGESDAWQRKRSFAFFLSLLDDDTRVSSSEAAFRKAAWSRAERSRDRTGALVQTAAQWSALIA